MGKGRHKGKRMNGWMKVSLESKGSGWTPHSEHTCESAKAQKYAHRHAVKRERPCFLCMT